MRNKNFHLWRIGTINIRTGKDDQKIYHEITKAKVSVCCLQEVLRLNINSAIITNKQNNFEQKYKLYWSGNAAKRQLGVGIAIKVDKGIEIEEIIPVSARIIVAHVLLYGCSLRVICCYAPTEEDSDSSKNIFYSKLNKKFECENTQTIICLGDLNASSSATWYNSSLRENRIIENLVVNDNGLRFQEFFNNRGLSVLNTWFTHKKCRGITWYSLDQVTKKVYDVVLACSWLRQYVSNCCVYNIYDNIYDSDYRLVIADICTPCTKVARYVKQAVISTKKYVNASYVIQPDISERFVNATFEKLENLDLNFTNSVMNDHLISSINSATEETLPIREKTPLYQPWHDDIISKELYDLKDLQIVQNANSNKLSKTPKRIRMRAKFFKNEYFKAEAAKFNQSAINRELDKLCSRGKKQESTLKPASGKCPPEKIFDNFKKHFNPTSLVDSVAPKELSGNLLVRELQKVSNNFPISHEVPTIDEIQKHLRQLKSRKASNDVDLELLQKCEHPLMLQVIHGMANNLWSNLDIPAVWGNSRLKTLWKGQSQIIVSIKDLASNQQCAS